MEIFSFLKSQNLSLIDVKLKPLLFIKIKKDIFRWVSLHRELKTTNKPQSLVDKL